MLFCDKIIAASKPPAGMDARDFLQTGVNPVNKLLESVLLTGSCG